LLVGRLVGELVCSFVGGVCLAMLSCSSSHPGFSQAHPMSLMLR
jgi:hypothetical protein